MSDTQPNQPFNDETQAVQGTRRMGAIPPPPERQPPPTPPPRPGSARHRRDNSLYLPLWSIALTFILVIALAAGIVVLVVSLGQDNQQTVNAQGTPIPPTQPPPVVIVSSPVPTARPESFAASPATPTLPPQFDPALNDGMFEAPPDFSLAGPTLPTVEISPTPISIGVGVNVIVVDVGEQQLNVRDAAGVFGTTVLFRAPENTRFTVVSGPQQVDNLTWWQITNVNDPTQSGWASAQYLQAVP
jgi:hypothetical protein